MKYKIVRNQKYDFVGQSYASTYPNLHKYPATMIPQIGIELLKELNISRGKLLDPYCGTGSSFIVGLDRNINEMYGNEIEKYSRRRSLEVSAFYFDLEKSIHDVAKSTKIGGTSIYIVGNRRVKNIQLPTDQFIAEKFEDNGFRHLFTYERMLGNKVMPLKNSPTNQTGQRVSTMTHEYIVVCEKITTSHQSPD